MRHLHQDFEVANTSTNHHPASQHDVMVKIITVTLMQMISNDFRGSKAPHKIKLPIETLSLQNYQEYMFCTVEIFSTIFLPSIFCLPIHLRNQAENTS
ncbi:uncharacterized protein UV8b_08104 [Ustilaginoidea virens]|uniref:Uncharacterized protein n=1 Tax=Ustilaginoidea virens TaxID=1159556 RepID=A0A8E5HYH4_USTVR|nr:uncharacterized protein UV8b_08104 [Ustilaginoidea virens]QUC23863.1 hypothetical protein UV8b_08104 [Ustilaginoidea virens]